MRASQGPPHRQAVKKPKHVKYWRSTAPCKTTSFGSSHDIQQHYISRAPNWDMPSVTAGTQEKKTFTKSLCNYISPNPNWTSTHYSFVKPEADKVETILAAAKPNWKRKCATSTRDNLGLENECLSCLLKQKLETNQNASFALSAKLFDALF